MSKPCFTWCSFTRFGEQGKVLLVCSGVLLELLDLVGIGGGTKSLGISYHLSSFECPLEELVSVPCITIYYCLIQIVNMLILTYFYTDVMVPVFLTVKRLATTSGTITGTIATPRRWETSFVNSTMVSRNRLLHLGRPPWFCWVLLGTIVHAIVIPFAMSLIIFTVLQGATLSRRPVS